MSRKRGGFRARKVLIFVLIASFLSFIQGATVAQAADGPTWELWPRGRSAPGTETPPPAAKPPAEKPIVESPIVETPAAPSQAPAAAVEKTGEEAGKKADAGVKSGTVGKWALVLAGIALIAVAAGGGGGGTTSIHP